ncbi:hypothetical protein Ae263Ps1_6416 [Pseudonocardia sp. Ae263_Ps1]|nr:hypothetical protein Ae263Ps1_6416 [Pseudonocardia sp. Ae263_Ps1]
MSLTQPEPASEQPLPRPGPVIPATGVHERPQQYINLHRPRRHPRQRHPVPDRRVRKLLLPPIPVIIIVPPGVVPPEVVIAGAVIVGLRRAGHRRRAHRAPPNRTKAARSMSTNGAATDPGEYSWSRSRSRGASTVL